MRYELFIPSPWHFPRSYRIEHHHRGSITHTFLPSHIPRIPTTSPKPKSLSLLGHSSTNKESQFLRPSRSRGKRMLLRLWMSQANDLLLRSQNGWSSNDEGCNFSPIILAYISCALVHPRCNYDNVSNTTKSADRATKVFSAPAMMCCPNLDVYSESLSTLGQES